MQAWTPDKVAEKCGRTNRNVEGSPSKDSVTWQGIAEPIVRMSLKAILFYQGESNFADYYWWTCALPGVFEEWRKLAQFPELPIMMAELTPLFNGRPYGERFRLVQKQKSETIPNLYLIQALDLGDHDSPTGQLHPQKKKPLAHRFMLKALHKIYDLPIQSSGPQLERIVILEESSEHYLVELTFLVETLEDRLHFEKAVCPKDWMTDTTPEEEFCSSFEVEFEGVKQLMQLGTPELGPDVGTVLLTIPRSGPEPLERINYAYSPWPLAILYSENGLPATAFSVKRADFHEARSSYYLG
jgi:hypothetical protein